MMVSTMYTLCDVLVEVVVKVATGSNYFDRSRALLWLGANALCETKSSHQAVKFAGSSFLVKQSNYMCLFLS